MKHRLSRMRSRPSVWGRREPLSTQPSQPPLEQRQQHSIYQLPPRNKFVTMKSDWLNAVYVIRVMYVKTNENTSDVRKLWNSHRVCWFNQGNMDSGVLKKRWVDWPIQIETGRDARAVSVRIVSAWPLRGVCWNSWPRSRTTSNQVSGF